MYTVQLIANNACGTDTSSQSININIVSSHDYLSEIYGLKVYLTPTSKYNQCRLWINALGEYTFELIDVLGKSIQKSTEWINASHRNIQMQLQPPGSWRPIYFKNSRWLRTFSKIDYSLKVRF